MPFWICGGLKLLKLKGAGIPEKLSQKPSESRVCLIGQVYGFPELDRSLEDFLQYLKHFKPCVAIFGIPIHSECGWWINFSR
jgi:hypothetical protein